MAENNRNGIWTKIAIVFISALLSVNAVILAGLRADIGEINTKLFTHLTNHDIHIPREQIVSKAEFDMHRLLINDQIAQLKSLAEQIANQLGQLTSYRK